MKRVCKLFVALLAALLCLAAPAEEVNGGRAFLLVARPGLLDPNFRESVVLAIRDDDGEAAGVIINRPTDRSLASILPGERFKQFTEPVFFGGPVLRQGLAALYGAPQPVGKSMTMLPGVFLTLEASTLDQLLHSPPQRIRFYVGVSGWAPGQLQAEIERGDWFVLEADADAAFTHDSDRLWRQLVRRARTVTADVAQRTFIRQDAPPEPVKPAR